MVTDTQTNRHRDRPRDSVCSSRPLAVYKTKNLLSNQSSASEVTTLWRYTNLFIFIIIIIIRSSVSYRRRTARRAVSRNLVH